MERALSAILRYARALVLLVIRQVLDLHFLIKLMLWNVAVLIALGRMLDVSTDTVKEFGACWTLLVVCAALAERDLIQVLRGRNRTGWVESYLILLPIAAIAFGIGYQERHSRLAAAAERIERQREEDEFRARMSSADVKGGLRWFAQFRRDRPATTRAATEPIWPTD
jgi:hypothetical protein